MTYAFVLDATACSGCKACQVACKDKNRLAPGVLWRRVYEVSGGGWKQEGAAWSSTVFAYNLSISCNHCVHPKCAGVCPVDAYSVRDDGIVILDSSKCMGCGYCAWACPYGAPQYDRASGRMTKCDFCYGNLELGLAPVCVSACPLRVLDYTELDARRSLPEDRVALWETPPASHPYPMSWNSHTQPHLAIKPHAGMKSTEVKRMSNEEEVYPRGISGWEEAPLVGFTLLMQMAVGAVWAMLWLIPEARLQLLPMLWIGLCLGAGLLTSFAHLGAKRNAWRALNHLRKSWLSREILFAVLFGAGWTAALISRGLDSRASMLFSWLTAWIGVLLIHCMSQIYRLPSVPPWDSWRTELRFFISAALLGVLGIAPLLAWLHISAVPWSRMGLLAIVLLLANVLVAESRSLFIVSRRLQFGLILLGVIGCALVFFVPGWLSIYSSLVLLLPILAGQILGRWYFYQARASH